MLNQIRSEWIKLKSVRSSIILLCFAFGITLLVAVLISIFSREEVLVPTILTGTGLAQLFFVVTGTQIIGQEYRFYTIRPTFSVTPNRTKVIAAKMIVLCGVIGATTFLLVFISLATSKIIFSARGIPFEFTDSNSLRIILCLIIGYMISGLFGFGIGAIVRQPIAGIIIGLVWIIVLENIIMAIYFVITKTEGIGIAKWLPFANFGNSVALEPNEGAFSPAVSLLYFFGISIVLCIIGSALINKRDA